MTGETKTIGHQISDAYLEEMTEEKQEQIAKIYSQFEKGITKLTEQATSDFIIEAVPYIFNDLYPNLIQKIKSLITYDYIKDGFFSGKEFRETILRENRAAIVADLNQDMLKKIDELQNEIYRLQRMR